MFHLTHQPTRHPCYTHVVIHNHAEGIWSVLTTGFQSLLFASQQAFQNYREPTEAGERCSTGNMKLHDLTKNLNFFRYHLLFFTLTPLLLSGIFYAVSSGEPSPATAGVGTRKVEYIDALFLCFSAMT